MSELLLVSPRQIINDAVRRVPAGLCYVMAPLPAIWWFWLGLTGGLGVEPIRALELQLGDFSLQLLIAGLAITPLRTHAGLNLIKFRRAIGVIAFFYVLLHLLVWLALDMNGLWPQILADIAKRPYITIGMVAFVGLVPLVCTSNNRAVRRLGPVLWRRLHRLTYPVLLLGGTHYLLVAKGWQLRPAIYLSVIVVLLSLRLLPRLRRRSA